MRSPTGSQRHARTRFDEVGLLLRTVAHLRPAQVAHRIRLRFQRVTDARWEALLRVRPRPYAAPVHRWPAGFRSLESRLDHGTPEDIAAGRFDLVGQVRDLGDPPAWYPLDAPRLWLFELHYFEWAWALAAAEDRRWARAAFASLWRSWCEGTTPGQGDAWAPYVVSLRAWVLCDVFTSLVQDSDIQAAVASELSHHARFIRSHLERDVGGNHLVKNLKALAGLGVFMGRRGLIDTARHQLEGQLPLQVLTDGGHFELSASYHCQVLADLLDIQGLLAAAGEPPVPGMEAAISRMQAWLGAMICPDGDIPLVNDAVTVGAERLTLLSPAAPADRRMIILPDSGYLLARPDERAHLVLDVGHPCPDELPAHAHADCLSFLLWIEGVPVIIDTGTSTYEDGPIRDYERSTAAHNTVEVDGNSQTEVWGAFRAGRRARALLELATDDGQDITVVGSHDGYRHRPGSPLHRRTWTIGAGRLHVRDQVLGAGTHRLVSNLVLWPAGQEAVRIDGCGAPLATGDCVTARAHQVRRPAMYHRLSAERATLPAELEWSITW